MQDIKDYLSYDPVSGLFTRLKNVSNCKAGSIAGCSDKKGYVQLKFNGKCYKAHRLAWYFTYGEMPVYAIDHKNEIKDDNRISNLRLDINRENEHNKSKLKVNNTSGYVGVHWHKKMKKWAARIMVKGKREVLGYYDTAEEASLAYLARKRELHPFWLEK